MPEPVLPSAEVVARVVDAECGYAMARLGVLEALPANPVGVERRRIGAGYAMSAAYLPNPHFNRVAGLTDDHANEIPELIDWFDSRGIAATFEVNPTIECPAVLAALAAAGFRHTGFHALVCGSATAEPAIPPPDVTTEDVTRDTLDDFLAAYARGWSVPEPDGFKRNVRGWLGQPDWHLFLGRLGGRPAGAAILFIYGGMGYCADSSVDPDHRGHGVHQALLTRRIHAAYNLGADLVCAQAAFASTSHRNMIRVGLATLHTKAVWTRPS